MAVVVVRGDEVVYLDTFGARDPERGLPVTPDTMFYIASCTKSFTAMGVMSLAEEGKLSVGDPVRKCLPRFELADRDATNSITIEDLLSHRKGLESDPIVTLDAFTGQITEDRFYYWLATVEPLGSFKYTNLHYTLAGRVIEALAGTSWKDFLDERIFIPARMTRTTAYASRMYSDADCAVPCVKEGDKIVPAPVQKTDRVMHAAGGMGTTVRDLGQWLRLNLNGGVVDGVRVLSAEGIERMQTLHAKADGRGRGIPNRTDLGYGLGWAIGELGGRRYVDHGGGYIGTSASISMMPDARLGVAVLANAGVPVSELVAMDVYDRMLKLELRDILPDLKGVARRRQGRVAKHGPSLSEGGALSAPPAAYAGVYDEPHWGTVELRLENGHFVTALGDLPFDLRANGTDAFVAVDPTGARTNGTFEIAKGQVSAILLELAEDGEYVRFPRR
jgi:CubicO group peptidase (beta-lactamase class C family)